MYIVHISIVHCKTRTIHTHAHTSIVRFAHTLCTFHLYSHGALYSYKWCTQNPHIAHSTPTHMVYPSLVYGKSRRREQMATDEPWSRHCKEARYMELMNFVYTLLPIATHFSIVLYKHEKMCVLKFSHIWYSDTQYILYVLCVTLIYFQLLFCSVKYVLINMLCINK